MILRVATGGGVGVVHAFRQNGPKERIVLDIDPEHRCPRQATELAGRVDQLVRRAIVVRLAADATTAATGKNNQRLHRWQVLARQCNSSPAAGRLTAADG